MPHLIRYGISGLRQAFNLSMLGLATVVAFALIALTLEAQTFSVLHAFKGHPDANNPLATLIRDAKGNLYGTTNSGGTFGSIGTVFKVDSNGRETLLHSFDNTDGLGSSSAVTRDAAGALYGTTIFGGNLSCLGGIGCGTVFKLTDDGKLTVLYKFSKTDGDQVEAGVILDAAGNLYGTTSYGGDLTCNPPYGCGNVFKLTQKGKLTVLHTFHGPDGQQPGFGSLIRHKDGSLYGTTSFGGASNNGTVFKIDTTGKESVLHSFSNTDGSNPQGGLVQDPAGNFFGTTEYGGGRFSDYGVVFKLAKNGKLTVLHVFAGSPDDGANPFPGLILDSAGNFYGTTSSGGKACGNLGCGTVFKIDKSGKETVLHSFTGENDGGNPWGGLVRDAGGNLYGTTAAGGRYGKVCACGVVFKLAP